MITSDTQLESKPVPQGEAPKDDIGVNSHPADGAAGGSPVLDGQVLHTERPNVNAMREAIETQKEMEVGKPVDVKQEEVKSDKAVTVEKGSGTQIIINIAGKEKKLTFSNRATASAFIKGASAKFGMKFKLVASEVVTLKPGDRIGWKTHQIGNDTRQGVVTTVLPPNDDNLVIFDAKQEDLGGNPKGTVWGYMGLVFEINGQRVKPVNPEAAEFEILGSQTASMAPQQDLDNDKPTTSGISDIGGGAPSFKGASKQNEICIHCGKPKREHKKNKQNKWFCSGWSKEFRSEKNSPKYESDKKDGSMKQAGGMNFSPSNVPSQVVQEFYPELQHELISYPNVTNAPMVNPEISGDSHTLGVAPAEGIGEAVLQGLDVDPEGEGDGGELLPGALEDAFDKLTIVSYVSTSPAGGMGIGRDGKSQVLEGTPLRKENDIRGPMFTDEFYQNYQAVPGAALAALKEKVAGADEKNQFALFLKRVMGEVAASFIAAFKVTSKMPMNKVPGVGEIQLAQIEQATNVSAFNIVNTGSRVKYLMDKLTDSEIQDAINDAFAQGAVWHDGKEGGFVYEVFVRAETIDTDSMILKYKFVTGTKEAE